MNHVNCNCEDCWWARGQREVCPDCGATVGANCPEKAKALEQLKAGKGITTGMLDMLGIGMETWLRYCQADKAKQRKVEMWAIYKLEPTVENANNVPMGG